MLFNNLEVTSGILNTATVVKKNILDKTVTRADNYIERYSPTSIKIPNTTGNTVHIALLAAQEYIDYLVGGSTITDFFPIDDNITETFSDFRGQEEISIILVSGVAAHDASLNIYVLQD